MKLSDTKSKYQIVSIVSCNSTVVAIEGYDKFYLAGDACCEHYRSHAKNEEAEFEDICSFLSLVRIEVEYNGGFVNEIDNVSLF